MTRLFGEIKKISYCRFLQELSGKKRQFLLAGCLVSLCLVLGWLLIPLPEAQRAGAAPERETVVAGEQATPVGPRRRVSRAEIADPFTLRTRAEQKLLPQSAGSLKKKPEPSGSVRLCGIISNSSGVQAMLAIGRRGQKDKEETTWLLSPGQSQAGIMLVSVDEAGGTAVIDDGQGEKMLVLGR